MSNATNGVTGALPQDAGSRNVMLKFSAAKSNRGGCDSTLGLLPICRNLASHHRGHHCHHSTLHLSPAVFKQMCCTSHSFRLAYQRRARKYAGRDSQWDELGARSDLLGHFNVVPVLDVSAKCKYILIAKLAHVVTLWPLA